MELAGAFGEGKGWRRETFNEKQKKLGNFLTFQTGNTSPFTSSNAFMLCAHFLSVLKSKVFAKIANTYHMLTEI